MTGKAIIFCAPSGAGKTTIVRKLLDQFDNLEFSISATTRTARPHEVHGADYYFLSNEDFQEKINANEILEWEEVYTGSCYGTLKEEVDRIWSKGMHVIFDVDVKGGINLKEKLGDKALAIFIKVENLDILKQRLKSRNTESEHTYNQRIEKATLEMQEESKFDEVIVNDNLERALEEAKDLVSNFIK